MLASQRRLLVPAHEEPHDDAEHIGVAEQDRAAQEHRLTEDCGEHRDVHRVAHVAIEAADNQPLRRDNRCGAATALNDEPHELPGDDHDPYACHCRAGHAYRQPVGRQRLSLPIRQHPGHQADHRARRRHEVQRAGGVGHPAAHRGSPSRSWWDSARALSVNSCLRIITRSPQPSSSRRSRPARDDAVTVIAATIRERRPTRESTW